MYYRILVVGDGHSNIHEVAVVKALKAMGHDVYSFYWCDYFKSNSTWLKYLYRLQYKYLIGPIFNRVNNEIISLVLNLKPQLVFVYRGTHVKYKTIIDIKKAYPKVNIFGYNNDDPFSKKQPNYLWRHFIRAIPAYNKIFSYREININEYLQHGASSVELLRSWFVPETNIYDQLCDNKEKKYLYDLIYIGHFEADGRFECLEDIVKSGYNLKIYGPPYEWNKLIIKSKYLSKLYPINLIWGDDYNNALRSSKIALCFLSKLNRDSYTRRCFEIPAVGTMLLSEYSEDLVGLFSSGIDADFFSSKDELLYKISYYLKNDNERNAISISGNARVINDGHDIYSRMSQVLRHIKIS